MNTPRPVRTSLLTVLLLSLATVALAQEQARTIEFYSPAVDRTMKYNILLPAEYDSSRRALSGPLSASRSHPNYTVWSRQGAPAYAGLFSDLIVVMPDGGNAWYINYAKSEGGQRNNWEDHIVQDVVGHVDGNYRTIARREGRAMTGLSMGGYGGLTLGLRNPEMFISIGEHQWGALLWPGRRPPLEGRGRATPSRSPSALPRNRRPGKRLAAGPIPVSASRDSVVR